MLEIRYYIAASGKDPFAEWFAELDAAASAKIVRALARIEQGNLSNVKGVGEGVLEFGSILVLVIGFISDGMARRSSSC